MKLQITIFLLLFAIGSFAQIKAPSVFRELTVEEGLKKAKEENKKLLVFVHASWDETSRTLKNVTLIYPDVIASIDKSCVAIELDAAKNEGFIKKHALLLPALVFFDSENNEVDRLVGGRLSRALILTRIPKL